MSDRAKHPGTILRHLLAERGIAVEVFITKSGLSELRARRILSREYRILPESALAIANAFEDEPWSHPSHWLDLWDDYVHKKPSRVVVSERHSKPGKRIDPEIREKVLELVDEGLSSEAAGEVVGLGKMSVAGIRAADTKGQYS